MTKTSIEKAIEITGSFEGNRGYSSVAGNFDGQGISFGLLQWNAGSHTLQPILRNCLLHMHLTMRNIFGNDDLYVLRVKLENDYTFFQWSKTLSYYDNQRKQWWMYQKWYDYFVKLGQTGGCQMFQRRAMIKYINNAKRLFHAYGFTTERAAAMAFDIVVQNGSVTPRAREQYRARMNPKMNEKAKLWVLGEAVADTAIPKWQFAVRARKRCIATGSGYVNGSPRVLPLTDEPATWGEFA
jgi:hypothetical protein